MRLYLYSRQVSNKSESPLIGIVEKYLCIISSNNGIKYKKINTVHFEMYTVYAPPVYVPLAIVVQPRLS